MVGKRLTDNLGKGSLTDLEAIDGIGRRTADVLRANGVDDLKRLARFADATALERHLHAHGVTTISLRHIENAGGSGGDWCAQARRIVGERPTRAKRTAPVEPAPTVGGDPTVSDDAALPVASTPAATNGSTLVLTDEVRTDRPAVTRFAVTRVSATWRPTSPETGAEHIDVSVDAVLDGPDADALAADRTAFVMVLVRLVPDGPPVVLNLWPGRLEPGVTHYAFAGSFGVPPLGRHETMAMVAGGSATARWEPDRGTVFNVVADGPLTAARRSP